MMSVLQSISVVYAVIVIVLVFLGLSWTADEDKYKGIAIYVSVLYAFIMLVLCGIVYPLTH